jgi:hypothetical protein
MESHLVVVVGLAAAGGLGWLQWRILKRLVGKPSDWAAASVIAAAVATPLTTAVLLDTLRQAGMSDAATLPVGLGLLAALVIGGAVWVGVVAWATAKR